MRSIDQKLIEQLVRVFSHGVDCGYDPATGIGCQRESLKSLGFGWLFFSLAQITEACRILVVGSGRGFSVACFALGAEQNSDAEVIFVDPGYDKWMVDGVATDTADGIWTDAETTAHYFQSTLGLRNIRYLRLQSDDAFQQFRSEDRKFDLVLIDGEHSYEQSLRDISAAWSMLAPRGIIAAHDAHCRDWPGVAAAIALFQAEQAEAEVFTLPLYPGLALIKRRSPLVALRHSTEEENETINSWRREAGVTERPNINDPSDPRVGETHQDHRIGLFSIFEEGELIGGFGVKYRIFTAEGPDNFPPDEGRPLEGFLSYGAVIRPDRRGRGQWLLTMTEKLRLTGDKGYYNITSNEMDDEGKPFNYRVVGRTSQHTAYHITWRKQGPNFATAFLAAQLQAANDDLRAQLDSFGAQLDNSKTEGADLRAQLEDTQRRLSSVLSSRIWRMTAPLRRLLDLL